MPEEDWKLKKLTGSKTAQKAWNSGPKTELRFTTGGQGHTERNIAKKDSLPSPETKVHTRICTHTHTYTCTHMHNADEHGILERITRSYFSYLAPPPCIIPRFIRSLSDRGRIKPQTCHLVWLPWSVFSTTHIHIHTHTHTHTHAHTRTQTLLYIDIPRLTIEALEGIWGSILKPYQLYELLSSASCVTSELPHRPLTDNLSVHFSTCQTGALRYYRLLQELADTRFCSVGGFGLQEFKQKTVCFHNRPLRTVICQDEEKYLASTVGL